MTENRNLSGLDLGQLFELNGRVKLRNFSSVLLAADAAPARFDDREVGNGAALERGHYFGGRLEVASDPRGRVYATLANQTQFIGAGTYATSAQGSLIVHALRQLDIELLPQLTWSAGEYRFARQVEDATNFWFGKLTANSVSATFRASYTFTPQLTLQAYAQAFLAVGHYDEMRSLPIASTTMGTRVTLAELTSLPRDVFAADTHPTSRTRRSTSTWCSAGSIGSARRSTSSTRIRRSRPSRCRRWDFRIPPPSIRTLSATAARRTCSC